jgi:hypothetical protein
LRITGVRSQVLEQAVEVGAAAREAVAELAQVLLLGVPCGIVERLEELVELDRLRRRLAQRDRAAVLDPA